MEALGDFRAYSERSNEWSKRTKYRFDKDIFKIQNLIFPIEDTYKNYDFYMKILKDNKKEKGS